ncbi:MAG: CRISPR system precrRNA processing endoribonuclease RAMP protein Cas6 [Lachnospiraceae bacterium]|nr:CRISPR system precrRNA processing endoribonuclease RAMP protein Cas6 [Lachnospiraceae bacterium]
MAYEDTFFDIPYVKLQFILEILEDTILPQTKVSALRGGMGEMLLQQNCVRDRDCVNCPFQKDCLVWDTFYSRAETRPDYVTGKDSVGYLIECGDLSTHFSAGSQLTFRLILFGRSITFFNVYLQAIAYLGMCGLGKYHAKFRIAEVRNALGKALIADQRLDMREYRIRTLGDYVRGRKRKLEKEGDHYVLVFVSPLCMKYHGEYLEQFSGEALVRGAMRRIQMLDFYMGHEAEQAEPTCFPEIKTQQVRGAEMSRYSSTQDAKMSLSGIRGKAVFEAIPEDCLDYLLAGELTHIGKNTSFGFGQYILKRE